MKQINQLTLTTTILAGLVTGYLVQDNVYAIEPLTIHKKVVVVKDVLKIQERQELERSLRLTKVEEVYEINENDNTLEIHEDFIIRIKKSNVVEFDLTQPSGLTVEIANKLLEGTLLKGLGKFFIEAEKKYGVNAYYLIAHAALESGWGTSPLAKNKNNIFGFTAYDRNPSGARGFKSKAECIDVVAKYISENYLKENGEHYNGPNLKGMNIKYASDKEWSTKIEDIMLGLIKKVEKNTA